MGVAAGTGVEGGEHVIVVDELQQYPASMTTDKGLPGRWWCHCTSDIDGDAGRAELLAFAQQIGLNPAWRQQWDSPGFHFDLTPSRRDRAIRVGAKEVEAREFWARRFERIAAWRKAKHEATRPVFGETPPAAGPPGCLDGGGRTLRS